MLMRLCIAILALVCWLVPSHARDFAQREIIGFSSDGNSFAFEQYGTQDGSGFAYSDIFIIDTRDDNWVAGSPYRFLLDDENETHNQGAAIIKARQTNRQAAAQALSAITDPGIVAASNPIDEKLPNRKQISIAPVSFWLPDNTKQMVFQIEELNLPAPQNCLDYDAENTYIGFRLSRIGKGGTVKIMHEDVTIPKTRNCPLSYRPSDVVIHISDTGKYTAAILIGMERIGFEGSDYRYLAVTGALN